MDLGTDLLADVGHFIDALAEVLLAVFVVTCLFFDVCIIQLLLKVLLTLVLRSQTFARGSFSVFAGLTIFVFWILNELIFVFHKPSWSINHVDEAPVVLRI